MRKVQMKTFVPASYNPRRISPEALAGLKASLARFGDLSGVVVNSRTGNVVAGHQRLTALGLDSLPDPPPETVGDGIRVRVVDWDLTTEKAANIAANSPAISGEFTDDLAGLLAELSEADAAMFEELRFEELVIPGPKEAPAEFPEVDENISTDHECPKCGYKFSGGK